MLRKRRTQFIFRVVLSGMFMVSAILSYPESDLWWLWGALSVWFVVDSILFAMKAKRQGNWDEVDFEKKGRINSYLAGYWAFWGMILFLLLGAGMYVTGVFAFDPVMLSSTVIVLGVSAFLALRLFYKDDE